MSNRILHDSFAISRGKAVCRVGKQVHHPIPAGSPYHSVAEVADGEFWSMTACAEHDPFLEPDQFRWRAGLAASEREAKRSKHLDTAELQHALGKFGVKLLKVITSKGSQHSVKDVILSDDGTAVLILLDKS